MPCPRRDPDFSDLELREDLAESILGFSLKSCLRRGLTWVGHIDVAVRDGILTLDSFVASLVHKPLAGAVA
jgi:hypothetical protein